jgi:hypothetical protein
LNNLSVYVLYPLIFHYARIGGDFVGGTIKIEALHVVNIVRRAPLEKLLEALFFILI